MSAFELGPGGIPDHNSAVGEYLLPAMASNASGSALTVDRLYVAPLWVPKTLSFDRFAFELTGNGGAGSVVRVGYYLAADGNDGVGALGADLGTIVSSSGAASVKALTIDIELTRGWYYLACAAQVGTAPSCRKSQYVLHRNSARQWTTTIVGSGVLYQAAVSGALPGTFTASGSDSTGPTVGLRIAA